MTDQRLAVILAAGQGRRLASHGNLPKGLVECGERALLELSLAALAAAGISEVIVVTGHGADLVESRIGPAHGRVQLRYCRNAAYAISGSMGSLLTAATLIGRRDFLLLESDLLYDPEFAKIAAGTAEDTLLAADLSGSGDEVFVVADDAHQLRFLGKAAPPEWRHRSRAEFAGISRVSAELYGAFCTEAAAWLARGDVDRHYEEVLFELARRGWPVRVRHCPGLPWTEIDTDADFLRAQRAVWRRLKDRPEYQA
jgi:choline kinase